MLDLKAGFDQRRHAGAAAKVSKLSRRRAKCQRLPAIGPVWPLTAGLWPRQMLAAMAQALERLPDMPEWQDAALLRREHWPGFAAALRMLQAPAELPAYSQTVLHFFKVAAPKVNYYAMPLFSGSIDESIGPVIAAAAAGPHLMVDNDAHRFLLVVPAAPTSDCPQPLDLFESSTGHAPRRCAAPACSRSTPIPTRCAKACWATFWPCGKARSPFPAVWVSV